MSDRKPRAVRGTALLAAVAAAGALTATGPAQALVGDAVADGTDAFTAYVNVGGERACTGALVDPRWILTASSCFSDDPLRAYPVPAGAPRLKTTVVVGLADLTGTGGTRTEVVEIVPRADRDVVMARLAQPVTGVDPVLLASTAPAQGETLRVLGYGRTRTAWVPDRLHSGAFTVSAAPDAGTVRVAGAGGTICRGDAGGPALRERDGKVELVALNSASWQGGCFGTDETETRTDAVEARVDDLGDWVRQVRALPQQSQVASGDFDGDGKADLVGLYDNGVTHDGKNRSSLHTFLGNATGFAAPKNVWTSSGGFAWSRSKLTAGDYNGDGKDDVSVFYDGGQSADGKNISSVYTWYSTGTGFAAPKVTWTTPGGFTWGASKVASGDFNGDRKADIGVFYDRGRDADGVYRSALFAFTSTGAAFGSPTLEWESPGSFRWSASKFVAGDHNGDGKDDVSVFYDAGTTPEGRNLSALYSWYSTGPGFGGAQRTWSSTGGFTWNAGKVASGDFNGDGKADVGVFYDRGLGADGRYGSNLYTFTSTGTAFGGPSLKWESTGAFRWSNSQFTAGDYNGDRKDDAAVLYDLGTTADGRKVDGVYSWLSTGTGFGAPASRWSGPIG
ncbi:FG-GAP-like repeat-containing protein [Streptomyces roseolilacinus]|uniref:Esterase n=1 Tax=Streptomyces roseolilacinus TaxID=66904 RepID=A0A918AYG9_9ACTN|nr:FG-GAP-like repeat-containing protein [Streptomyces roseolilacinus]GGQ01286.1 esterase [Streptomyces roseolilacinus]